MKTYYRWTIRAVFLAAGLVLLAGGPLPFWVSRAIPSLSPLGALASFLVSRGWVAGLWWLLPPVIIALSALWKGRLFCRWICPLGTLHEAASNISLGKRILRRRISGVLFWTIVFSSIAGAPLFLLLDPLPTFNRLAPAVRGGLTVLWLVPGLLLPVVLLAALVQPMIWCAYLCPLGYFFGFLKSTVKKADHTRPQRQRERRDILTGLAAGLPLGLLSARLPALQGSKPPVLPPGARDPSTFAALCSRCYACLNICPEGIIRIGSPLSRSVPALFSPELDFDRGFCRESCNRCTQVCPTGAIEQLTFARKHARKIGTARVVRSECLAWKENKFCLICDEHCSYGAFDIVHNEQGVPCPVVKTELCRGCGQCRDVCLDQMGTRGIEMEGVERQSQVRDDPGPRDELDSEADEPESKPAPGEFPF